MFEYKCTEARTYDFYIIAFLEYQGNLVTVKKLTNLNVLQKLDWLHITENRPLVASHSITHNQVEPLFSREQHAENRLKLQCLCKQGSIMPYILIA